MSNNLFMFFVFATLCAALLDGIMGGNTGFSTTNLTANMTASATTANVQDTSGMPNTGLVQIEDEIMCFSGKTSTTLTGLLRGQRCGGSAVTSPVDAHDAGRRVFSEAPGLFNSIIGFDIASNFSGGGVWDIAKGLYNTVFNSGPEFVAALARIIMWDFDMFRGE